jgi:hypothetical protein
MSRKPSKFRKAKRAQRETRAMRLGTEMHKAIEKHGYGTADVLLSGAYHVSDKHIGMIDGYGMITDDNAQLRAYAAGLAECEVEIVQGGDLIHGACVTYLNSREYGFKCESEVFNGPVCKTQCERCKGVKDDK